MNTRIYSKKTIESLKSSLVSDEYKSNTYPKFIFLCGAGYSKQDEYNITNRGIIDSYIKSKDKYGNIFIVLSEKLWEYGFTSNIDLLTFEEFLAEVSDSIILFSESPGSYAELGAFAYAGNEFSKKLTIVIDKKYEGSKSFLNTGPVFKSKNNKANVIYAPLLNCELLSSKEMRDTINSQTDRFSNKLLKENRLFINKKEESVNIKSFIVEILELIKILQPINKYELIDVYKEIKNFKSFKFVKKDGKEFSKEIKYDYIIKLLNTTNLIKLSNDTIKLNNAHKIQHFMFKSINNENQQRNKLLCRKYKYEGNIE